MTTCNQCGGCFPNPDLNPTAGKACTCEITYFAGDSSSTPNMHHTGKTYLFAEMEQIERANARLRAERESYKVIAEEGVRQVNELQKELGIANEGLLSQGDKIVSIDCDLARFQVKNQVLEEELMTAKVALAEQGDEMKELQERLATAEAVVEAARKFFDKTSDNFARIDASRLMSDGLAAYDSQTKEEK